MFPIRSTTNNKLNTFDQYLLIAGTTTDFLTAASTIDTLGVGITAAAGTKLALQFSYFSLPNIQSHVS